MSRGSYEVKLRSQWVTQGLQRLQQPNWTEVERGTSTTVICRRKEKTRLESYHSYCQILIVEETQPIVNMSKHLEPSDVIENLLATTDVMLRHPHSLEGQGRSW